MNTNRIQGAAEQGERANNREALVVKAKWRRFGGCDVYVRSQKAGERVMGLLKRRYDKLHLKINESKSTVAKAFGRKFLGYAMWMVPKAEVKRAVPKKALEAFRQKIRQLTRRSGRRSIRQVIEDLRSYVLGWKGYFDRLDMPRLT
jgi:RNA-directed DNA polymerase